MQKPGPDDALEVGPPMKPEKEGGAGTRRPGASSLSFYAGTPRTCSD